jgi:small nuclear ribonucleoprotein (snRNP)-like protein
MSTGLPAMASGRAGFLTTIQIRSLARRDAQSYLKLQPKSHTPSTRVIEGKCQIAQHSVLVWLTNENETYFAQLEDIDNRIDFVNARLENFKSRKVDSDRESASNFAKISQAHQELLEKMALRATITEAIIANYEVAELALETWRAKFEQLTSLYLGALIKRARKILKLPRVESSGTIECPDFMGLRVELRAGFTRDERASSTKKRAK